MAIWIKNYCPSCTDPCVTQGCACDVVLEVEPNNDVTWDVRGLFPISRDLLLSVGYVECDYISPPGGTGVVNFQIQFWADGVLLYDSGCVASPISQVVTVPACTLSLRAVSLYDCLNLCDSGASGNPNLFITCN